MAEGFTDRTFDSSPYPTRICAAVDGFKPTDYMDAKPARRMARFSQLAVAAATMAVADAGLTWNEESAERIGVVMSNSVGSVGVTERNYELLRERGYTRMDPLFMALVLPNMVSATVAIALNVTGYNTTVVTACAGGTTAIGEATEAIRRGVADVILAGGADAPISEITLAGMSLIGALSRRNDDPKAASRPFDAGRDGFVASEGGACLVLESLEHARSRGARILAEVKGYGATCDAHHITGPEPNGTAASRAMRLAMADARVQPEEIDHINAHATSTPLGDKVETMAIKRAFGEHAYRIPVTANKSMTGHMFAASGAVEALCCVRVITDGVIPPTINHEKPDPDCDLDYTPNVARQVQVRHVLSNSFGFGGQNACLVFGPPPE
jgi:3-oxoacyl-[acyl-carrier-protein] synthase II